jgi:hypothetical protein
MRRTIILLVLAIAAGLLEGCSSSTQHAPSAHSTAVAPTGTRTSTHPTRSRALAFAHAVNLTAADLPGFTASSKHERETAQEKQQEREMQRCVGSVGSARGLAEASSKDFELKHDILDLSVSSEVSVARTPATATAELAAIHGAHVQGCLSHYLSLLLKSQQYGGATISPVSIESGTPPAPGTTGSFGWRVTATLTTHRIRISFYIDILGFVYGPARVTLFSSGVLQPFPAQAEERLFTLLLHRAKAHSI